MFQICEGRNPSLGYFAPLGLLFLQIFQMLKKRIEDSVLTAPLVLVNPFTLFLKGFTLKPQFLDCPHPVFSQSQMVDHFVTNSLDGQAVKPNLVFT